MNSLKMKSLAFSLGISWGIGMLFLGWVAIFDWGVDLVDVMSSLYIGYSATFLGGIIGGLWGFVDGAIFGILIAFFYNMCCCCKKPAKATKARKKKK